MSAGISGKSQGEFFNILCEDCGRPTLNEYLGGVMNIRQFEAFCEKCGYRGKWTFHSGHWTGLPAQTEE